MARAVAPYLLSSMSNVRHEENTTSSEEEHHVWVDDNWPKIMFWCLLAIAIGIVYVIFHKRSIKEAKDGEIRELHPAIYEYWHALSGRDLPPSQILLFIFFAILLFPVIALTVGFSLLLAVLIPLGFIFGLVEHRFGLVWAFLVVFINIGGLLDLATDISLIGMLFIDEFNGERGVEGEELKGYERQLFIARIFITFASSFMAMLITLLLLSSLGKLLDRMTGKEVWTSPRVRNYLPRKGLIFMAFFAALFWKIILIGMRANIIAMIRKSVFKHKKITEPVQRKVQWMELVLYMDLMMSGIPLGIVTLLELLHETPGEEQEESDKIMELVKLSALGVDLIGASFIFWYIVVGLIRKIPVLHHHHHSPSSPLTSREAEGDKEHDGFQKTYGTSGNEANKHEGQDIHVDL